MAYRAEKKGDEDKLAQALTKLCIEDLTLKSVIDAENKQSLLYGIGHQQLEVVASKLKDRYKVDDILDSLHNLCHRRLTI